MNEQIDSLFTDESITGSEAEMVREYYEMFLDWDSRAEGKTFYLEHLKPIQDITSLEELSAYLSSEECLKYGAKLTELSLNNHPERDGDWIIRIRITSLSASDSAEYEEETAVGSRYRKYEDGCASYMLQYAGYSAEEAAELVAQRYAFEKMLAPWIMTDEESTAPEAAQKLYNIRSREALATASPKFPMLAIIDRYGFNPEIDINLTQPRWLEGLNECFTEENLPLIRAYLLCEYAGNNISLLDEPCYREYQRLQMEYNGTSESMEDEYYAAKGTSDMLYDFVDRMYVQKYCPKEKKEKIESLIAEIVGEYRKMIQEEDWLSEETRETALLKLDTLRVNAVYPEPDQREDWSDFHFHCRAEGGNYLTAYKASMNFDQECKRKRSYSEPNKNIWMKSAYDVDASYSPDTNAILVMGGILNGVFYREDMSREELLGAIGLVIGHEITHGFDMVGSQYDENGVLRDWWSDSDRATFERRSEKLSRYYDSLRPWKDGSAYSGKTVQTEAVADLGAMACILRIAAKTPGFDYDAFFRSYAKTWCIKYIETFMENFFRIDEHPMDHLRVNVVLAQFPEFQETYGIQPGDGMYVAAEDRIAIWGVR